MQHPMLRAADEEFVPGEIRIDNPAAVPVRFERRADSAEQLSDLSRVRGVDFDHVEPVFGTDVCTPHPLCDPIRMCRRPREQQVERTRKHGFGACPDHCDGAVVGVRQNDHSRGK